MIVSTDDEGERGYELGAWSVLAKPIAQQETLEAALSALRAYVDAPRRELLLMAPQATQASIAASLSDALEVHVTGVTTPEQALESIGGGGIDGVVVSGAAAEAVAGEIERRRIRLPMVYFEPAGFVMGETPEVAQLERFANVPRVDTLDRLLDATTRMLHQRIDSLPARSRVLLQNLDGSADALAGRRALIVDDDVRNIFALTSVLEKHDMTVFSAETGQGAIDFLEKTPDIDVVLMDIMMPGMDGFDTIRAIRRSLRAHSLPIIAVTAKAMKGDREKTFEAGAWDYLAKPVEPDRMLAVLRAWLHR
jgi:CheY-like chemotaxis protein